MLILLGLYYFVLKFLSAQQTTLFIITFLLFSICMSGNKLLSAICLQEVRCDHFQKMSLKLCSMFADLLSHNCKHSLVLLISGSV